jgi:hypothetical protein
MGPNGDLRKVAVVEGNPGYRDVAMNTLPLTYVNTGFDSFDDYHSAQAILAEPEEYDGVLVGTFMPNAAGSKDMSLGKAAIEAMRDSDQVEKAAYRMIDMFNQLIDVEGRAANMVRNCAYFYASNHIDMEECTPLQLIISKRREMNRHELTSLAKKHISCFEDREFVSPYDTLYAAMGWDEANQSLGVTLASQLGAISKPVMLVIPASTEKLPTEPIRVYADELPIKSIAVPDETPGFWKAPAFWQLAYMEMAGLEPANP